MDPHVVRLITVAALVLGAPLAGTLASSETGQGLRILTGEQYSVHWLMRERPLDEEVQVTGRIVHVRHGNALQGRSRQRFVIADAGGTETVAVVCDRDSRQSTLGVGSMVRVTGTFESAGEWYRVRTVCSQVSPL